VAVLIEGMLTWSNALTGLRLVSVPFFHAALMEGDGVLAAALFWIAVLTDFTDGRVARARGESTPFGGLFDHATDAGFVVVGLAALAQRALVPALLPLAVALAFVQYVLDSKSLAGSPLRTSMLGRWNGVLYFVPLGIVATREGAGFAWPSDAVVHLVGLALLGSTVISMADRAWALLRGGSANPQG
jgi:phosphatidylglycerophosphate synthase